MNRLKVLISAYACEPDCGSEPGVGWNTACEMAKYHDVWVLTRANNRPAIEAKLAQQPVPGLHFGYYDLPEWARWWKKGLHGMQLYYYLWQLGAYFAARKLHREHRFDLAHHVTFIRYWTPSLVALLPIPFIWGPVGGGETVPEVFRKEMPLRARLYEVFKDAACRVAMYDPLVRLTAQKTAVAFANTEETAKRLRALGVRDVRVMGEASLDQVAIDYYFSDDASARPPGTGPLHFSSMTRLVHWKGVHLGLQAFAQLGDKTMTYWILGTGPEEERLRRLAEELGVADRVKFLGAQPRTEWFRRLEASHALVHPSLSNTGNCISLEAMAAGRPVLCLNVGGITSQVTEETGFKIGIEDPAQTVTDLAEAMRRLARDPELPRRMGQRGRERVQRLFTWPAKAQVFHEVYLEVISNGRARSTSETAASDGAELARAAEPHRAVGTGIPPRTHTDGEENVLDTLGTIQKGTGAEAAELVTVVVLGMHRSGTSMTAGILEALGVDMGKELKESNQANPIGFFEDCSFLHLNKKILEAAGGNMYAPPPPDAIASQKEAFEVEIRELVERKQSTYWGWKDPSTSLIVELYLKHLKRPHFIVCHRDPIAVAKSLQARGDRGGMRLNEGVQLVRTYEAYLDRFFAKHPELPRLDVPYEEITQHPGYWVDRIADFLGFRPTQREREEAVARVLPKDTIRILGRKRLVEKALHRPWKIPGYVLKRIRLILKTRGRTRTGPCRPRGQSES